MLKSNVRSSIGSFGVPDYFIYGDLPKTRSGKIMRRILRKIAAGVTDKEELGDISTLADSTVSKYVNNHYLSHKTLVLFLCIIVY